MSDDFIIGLRNQEAIDAFMHQSQETILKLAKDSQGRAYLEVKSNGIWSWIARHLLHLESYQLETVVNLVEKNKALFDHLEVNKDINTFYETLNTKAKHYNEHREGKSSIAFLPLRIHQAAATRLPIERTAESPLATKSTSIGKPERAKLEFDPEAINLYPEMPLLDIGLGDFNSVLTYVEKHGAHLESLNLLGLPLNNDQFAKLVNSCPNLRHLKTDSKSLTEAALEHLQGKHLESVVFSHCYKLTNAGIAHLKGNPLSSIECSYCDKLTDDALAMLKEMPLTSVNFEGCTNLTNLSLAHLAGMPLREINFSMCHLTDDGMHYLQGMPLSRVDFSFCHKFTDAALAPLELMPLTFISFDGCPQITPAAIDKLKKKAFTNVQELQLTPEEKIARKSSELIRSMIGNAGLESIDPAGEWRVLYLNENGEIQGVQGPDDQFAWIKDAHNVYEVEILVQRDSWKPDRKAAFEIITGPTAPGAIAAIPGAIAANVDATIKELNDLANGAYQLAQKDYPDDPRYITDRWFSIFTDPGHYSTTLLREQNQAWKESLMDVEDFLM